jgi:hypothetical protein
LLIVALMTFGPPVAGEELRAGFGVAALPTPENAPLAGYGGLRDRRAEGVSDPPEARALVLERGDLRVALIAVDLVIVRPALRDPLIEEGRQMGVDSVILVATHTHSGPGGYLEGWLSERITGGDYDPASPERLVRAAARAMARAVGDLRPARVGAALGQCDLSENRRDGAKQQSRNVPVLRIEDRRGSARRALFAYGAHPTVLSPKSRMYSADYPGAARAWLEKQGWESVFLPGALGDQGPRTEPGPSWPDDVAVQEIQKETMGRRLGETVLAALEQATPAAHVPLHAVERWVELPPARFRRGCLVWWLGPVLGRPLRAFLSPRVPIHAIRVGNTVFLGVPAEPTMRVGERLRAQVPQGEVAFVVSHANDWIGYVVTADGYRQGGYEACFSFHGPDFADWLVAEATETLRLLAATGR